MNSKIGSLYLVASSKGLCGLLWKKQKTPMAKNLKDSQPEIKILAKAVYQLEEYFKGTRKNFNLPSNVEGTPFQKSVWKQLSTIAQKIKNNYAVRAVGSANGKNPLPIIIPCHRVIAADGTIGGYAGGLKIKNKLLNLEKMYVANNSYVY